MDTRGKLMMTEVSVTCPVCCSGNRFETGRAGRALACEDCGFVLAEESASGQFEDGECIFCGGGSFYLESPLSLPFLRRDFVCYVCEARYKGARANEPDEKFKQEGYERARSSEAFARWDERARRYE